MIGRGAWLLLVTIACAAGAPVIGRAIDLPPGGWNAPAPAELFDGGPDRVRGLIYRIDGEARVARLHPNESLEHARAAARMSGDLPAQMRRAPMLQPSAARLRASAEELSRAAQRGDPEDVRAAAIEVEIAVRTLDDLLPAPAPAR